MSGSVLGQDQIDKINTLYASLHAHIKDLLMGDASPYKKMRTYLAVEYLNTTELASIFEQLPYISPAEKRALVRAAIDDVRHGVDIAPTEAPQTDNAGVVKRAADKPLTKFSPPPFKLNVATTKSHDVV